MNRRSFLRSLFAGGAAAAGVAAGVVDLDQLLWVPGKKTIFIPLPPPLSIPQFGSNITLLAPDATTILRTGDVITIAGRYVVNPVTREATDLLKQFVVTCDAKSDSDGHIQLAVYPPIITPDTSPYPTVSSPPTNQSKFSVFPCPLTSNSKQY